MSVEISLQQAIVMKIPILPQINKVHYTGYIFRCLSINN